jgi:hypothetical protein
MWCLMYDSSIILCHTFYTIVFHSKTKHNVTGNVFTFYTFYYLIPLQAMDIINTYRDPH